MFEFEDTPYHLEFVELGDYDTMSWNFKTLQEAKQEQKRLIKDHDKTKGYYTHIAKIIKIRRKEPDEDEQFKRFD